jgi:hypothetical protein
VVVLVRGDAEVARWPLEECSGPDLVVADALARWQLGARRVGCSIEVHEAAAELLELLDLLGFGDVVTLVGLRVETSGKVEGGEEVGVDEVVVADDPVP